MLTTCSTTPHYPNDRVEARNAIVTRLAEARGLTVIDLYTVACANREHIADGVHFDGEGYKALAEELMRVVEKL
jgi:lysophospholipase L1-like esterase